MINTWKNIHLAPIYNAKYSMYCDIKLGNMETFTWFFHFPYRSYLYNGKQEKHGVKAWKIFFCAGMP